MFALLANLSLGIATGLVAALSLAPDPPTCGGCGLVVIAGGVSKWSPPPWPGLTHIGYTIFWNGVPDYGSCTTKLNGDCDVEHCDITGSVTFTFPSDPDCTIVVGHGDYNDNNPYSQDFSLTACGGSGMVVMFQSDFNCNEVPDFLEGTPGNWTDTFMLFCKRCEVMN